MRFRNKLVLSVILLIVASGCASAQQGNSRAVAQYLCKDVMREHGDNRDVAIAFLQGFILGKSGSSAFDLDVLHKQTTDFIEYCLDHPAENAINAMAKIRP
jgi:HdeA/HdeB family